MLTIILFAQLGAAVAVAAEATEPIQVFAVAQQDLDNDGTPDVTIIECAFATERDQVLVFDQNGDMPWGNRWQDVTNFRDEVWVFDVGADGTAQLIVIFTMEGGHYTALVYDDIDGDAQVPYRIDGDQIKIEESAHWHVKVQSEKPWDLQEANLKYWIDGYDGLGYGVSNAAMFDLSSGRDGLPDWQIDVADSDGDGTIDYQLQWAVSPYLVNLWTAGIHKMKLLAKPDDPPLAPHTGAIFWPLLTDKRVSRGSYFDQAPEVVVDWEAGTVTAVGILGFPVESGYHIFSRLPLEKNSVNPVNWENPMAYFDMANDQDGWPELQYRFNVKTPYDPYFPFERWGTVATPNLEVHVSWDQNNVNAWEYKISLSSNDDIDTVVEFPDFAIASVPYDEVVSWVRDRTWDMATFTQDYRPSRDSEGMFAKGWQVNRGWENGENVSSLIPDLYMTGFSDRLPIEYYQDIQEGMRGEHSFQYFDTPKIYLSALDRQLHLLGAEAGVWNLGEGRYLRYANLNGDAYLDQWQEERNGEVVQQLNDGQGFLVYSGNGGVQMKQTDVGPALLETKPPGNYEDWQRLDEQMKAHQTTLAPANFTGMLAQFPGSEMRIQGAAARDYRITPQGFRFVLELQPEFDVYQNQYPLILPETPGTYMVSFDDNAWSVQPATPVAPRIDDVQVDTQNGNLRALSWTKVEALVHNDGLVDVQDLLLCATFDDNAGHQVVMTDTVALLPGKGQQRVVWDWAPPAAGSWQVEVVANCSDQEATTLHGQARAETVVQVSGAARPSVSWLISLGGQVSESVLLFLFATVVMAGVAAATWVSRSGV